MRNIEPPVGFLRAPPQRSRVSGHDTVNAMDAGQRFEALLASGKDGALLRFSLGMHYLGTGELQAEPAGAAGDERNPAAQRGPAPSPGPKAEGRAEGETDERETPMAHGECLLRPCWGAHPCNCKAGCDR